MPAGRVPLFIGLHGGTGWGDQFARTDHVEGLAESNRFIVVYPDGVQQGAWPGGTPAMTPTVGAGYVGYDATAESVGFLLNHPCP